MLLKIILVTKPRLFQTVSFFKLSRIREQWGWSLSILYNPSNSTDSIWPCNYDEKNSSKVFFLRFWINFFLLNFLNAGLTHLLKSTTLVSHLWRQRCFSGLTLRHLIKFNILKYFSNFLISSFQLICDDPSRRSSVIEN